MKPIKTTLWALLGIASGLALAFVLVVAVEGFSEVVHPMPEGAAGSVEEICRHVERYPGWVLGVILPAWGLAAMAGVWTAGRIGGLFAAIFVGVLLFAAAACNLWMLPYPVWFKAGTGIAVLAAVHLGALWGSRTTKHAGPEEIGDV